MSVMGTLRGVFLLLSFFPQYLWKLYFPNFDTVLLADFLLHFTLSLLGFIAYSLPLPPSFHSYTALFPFLIPLFSIGSFNVFTLSYTIKWGKVGNCGKFLYFSSFSQLYSLSITYFTYFSYFTCFGCCGLSGEYCQCITIVYTTTTCTYTTCLLYTISSITIQYYFFCVYFPLIHFVHSFGPAHKKTPMVYRGSLSLFMILI